MILPQRLLWGFLFFLSSLYGDLVDPHVQAATEGDPANTLCDSVSLLTGDFVAFSEDLRIEGAQPLVIRRSYVSGDGEGFYGGWEFFPHKILRMLPRTFKKSRGKDYRRIQVCEPNGTTLTLKRTGKHDVSKGYVQYFIDFEKRGKGITNLSRGEISGQHNLRNTYAYRVTETKFELYCSDGTLRKYSGSGEGVYPRFYLSSEKLPNGNQIFYKYDKKGMPIYIKTTNPSGKKIYAWCEITYGEGKDFTIISSDGRELSYEFKKRAEGKAGYLRKTIRPDLPKEKGKYLGKKTGMGALLRRRILPDGRELGVHYYGPGDDLTVGNKKVKIKYFGDDAVYRVRELLQPLGEKGALIPTHQFIYDVEKQKDERGESVNVAKGITHLFDPDQNETIIEYLPNYLTKTVSHYVQDKLNHQFFMEWEEYGQLKSKVLADPRGKHLLKRSFIYDNNGNPIEESVEGTICKVDSLDKASIHRKYDDRNRLIEVTTPAGLTTKTTYFKTTNLVSKKIITDGSTIHKREFTHYNEDHIPILKITDDGEDEEEESLSGVTCRILEKITPKAEAPAQNLPEVIEEWGVVDLETGEKTLLSKTCFEYNKLAKVVRKQVYDSENTLRYTLEYSYDDRGNIIREVDPEGQEKLYAYDTLGNLIYQADPSGKVTRWTYDHGNRPINVSEKIPSGEERITQHTYNLKNEKTSTTDPFGNTTHYEYDPFGHLTTTTHPNKAKETLTYDPLGHTTSKTNLLNGVTKLVHNIEGKPLEIIDPTGAKETFTYNLDGTLATHTNTEGLTTLHTYDALGRTTSTQYEDEHGNLLAQESYTYNSFHLVSYTNKDGATTRYTYDFAGRKIAEETERATIQYTYDPLGRISTETKEGHTLTYKRDLLNRILEEKTVGENGLLLHLVKYSYDANNHKTEIRYPRGTYTYVYDPFHRLLSETTPTKEKTQYFYNEKHKNDSGATVLRKTTLDPLGYKTIETFDPLLHLVEKKITTPDDRTLFHEEYQYDVAGNKTLHRCHLYRGTEHIKTLDIHKTYDILSRLTSIHQAKGAPEEKKSFYTYTPSGLLKTVTKNDRIVVTYSYDPFGHQTRITTSDGTIDTSYIHTPCGHFKESTNQIDGTTTTYTLDPFGRPLSVTLANGLQVENTYDLWGRRTQLLLPHQEAIDYSYGPLHLHQVSYRGHTTTYTYDNSSQLIERTLDETTHYSYDPSGRATHLQHPEYTERRTYNPKGDVLHISSTRGNFHFGYDGLRQLTTENNHQYAYDSYHNRIEKDDTPYSTNEIHAIKEAGPLTFDHDPNGNPTTQGDIHYTYDGLDRLIELERGPVKVVYTYDCFDRRMTKTTYRLTGDNWSIARHVRFLWDGNEEIGAYTENDLPIEVRILGNKSLAEQETLLIQLGDNLYKPLHDLAGNILQIRALDGSHQVSYQYNAFGEETLSSDPNPWRYRSKRVDPETGLLYFGHRYYDPEHGRFLTPDSSPLTDSINLYAYTFNNPLAFHDLYGHNSTEASYFDHDRYAREWADFKYFRDEGVPMPYVPSVENLEYGRTFDLGRPELQDKQIMFVNGIMNSYKAAEQSAFYLSELSGGYNVHTVHVATHSFSPDIAEAVLLKRGVQTPGVKAVQQAWTQFFKNASPTASILVIPHSKGGLVVKNALLTYDNELRKRIHILAIAPACYSDPATCGSVRSYVSKRDIVHRFDWMNKKKYRHTITELTRSPGASRFIDHDFQSPTFRSSLADGVASYIQLGAIQ